MIGLGFPLSESKHGLLLTVPHLSGWGAKSLLNQLSDILNLCETLSKRSKCSKLKLTLMVEYELPTISEEQCTPCALRRAADHQLVPIVCLISCSQVEPLGAVVTLLGRHGSPK